MENHPWRFATAIVVEKESSKRKRGASGQKVKNMTVCLGKLQRFDNWR